MQYIKLQGNFYTVSSITGFKTGEMINRFTFRLILLLNNGDKIAFHSYDTSNGNPSNVAEPLITKIIDYISSSTEKIIELDSFIKTL